MQGLWCYREKAEDAEAKLANLKAEAEKALNAAQNLVLEAKAKADAAEKRAEDAEAKLANATANLTNPPTDDPANWTYCGDVDFNVQYVTSFRCRVSAFVFPFSMLAWSDIISLFLAHNAIDVNDNISIFLFILTRVGRK